MYALFLGGTFLLMLFLNACGIVETLPAQDADTKAQAEASLSRLYDVIPDVESCDEGVLKESEKNAALKAVNEIRALHGLKPVSYNYHDDIFASKSALISVANNDIEHHPPKSAQCYSTQGALGSETSNLHIDYEGSYEKSVYDADFAMMRFLVDDEVPSLGHRRWMLFPFLKEISYGRVDGTPIVTDKFSIVTSVSLKVISDEIADISDTDIHFVAYPYENYPSKYFKHGWYSSFSVLVDKENRWDNSDVDYSHAKILVTDEKGVALRVKDISFNKKNFGLSNIIQWKIVGTKNNTKYQVKIENVLVKGEKKSYDYWFNVK